MCLAKHRANGLRRIACKPEVAMLQQKCGTILRALALLPEARLSPPPDCRERRIFEEGRFVAFYKGAAYERLRAFPEGFEPCRRHVS
jgi:hypothetical protein